MERTPRTPHPSCSSCPLRQALGAALTCGCLLAAASPASAADLIEPWDPGLTDAEMFVSFGEGSGDREVAHVAGFGLGHGLSFGLSHADGGGAGRGGMLLVYTRSLGPHGRLGELDLWGELQSQTLSMDEELGAAEKTLGFEWSAPSRWSRYGQTYVRLSAARSEGATLVHPLVGIRLPTVSWLDLHVELSGEEPETGPWPVHLAIGPNVALTDGIELVPEVAVIRDRGPESSTSMVFSVGVVVDPSPWLGRFGGFGHPDAGESARR